MANYSLIANSTFQPFSYQELMAPVQRMGEYHAKIADEYDKLSSQADILKAMGANDIDKGSGSYNRYKAYSDKLRAEADALYNFGLNTESRQRLSDLRRLYNTEIVPIQNAWNKREEESKMQLIASMQNPDLRFTRDARNTSLDDYIKNPQGGYGVVNLKAIYSDMSALANNLSKLKRAGRKEGIDKFTYNLISQYGLDPNLVSDWVNNPDASPTLTNMMNQVLAKYGVNTEEFANTPNGASILNEAIGAAQMGAWSAVGEDKEHILEDKEKALIAQAAKEIAVAKAVAKIKADEAAAGNSSFDALMSESLYDLPMQEASGDTPAQVASVRALNYEKDDWNPTSKNYTVREITKYQNGKPVFDTKTQSLGELLNKKDSSKNNVNVSTYWSETPGNEGLILATTEDGKPHRYFISADNMPENNVQGARQYFKMAEQYRDAGMVRESLEATQIAYAMLHTGLTVRNKAYDQSIVRQPSLKQQGLVDE